MRKFHIMSKRLFILIFGMLALTNCNDWLDVAPEDELVKEDFWQKTSDVYGGLAATYNAMRSASLQSLILGECRADLVNFTGPDFSQYAQIAASNISPNNSAVSWRAYYSAINLANTLMFYNKEVFELDNTFTQEMLDGVDAEALFIRSLAYFYLVRLWKDVPLVIEPSISDTTNLYIGKSTEKEVIQQIINDLLKAKDMAYTTQYYGSEYFYGRANKYSIMALLADVYLWDEQYQKCIDYCDSISNTGLYGLEDTETWFRVYYPGNSANESIFEFQYNSRLDNQSNPVYNNLITTYGATQVTLNTRVTNLLLNREDARNFQGRGAVWKYRGKDALGLVQRTSTEEDANWIIYRYADIMLMKAEACIELDRFEEANSLIRETMLRAGMPYEENFDKTLLRQALLDEKGREFLLEGKRWFDLLRAAKRNKFQNRQIIIDMILSGADIKQQAILRTKVYDTLSYYLPIAERELIYNQNLVQNPYYDR
jgi:starch-binding outer membrane protein, SusD/RagB family